MREFLSTIGSEFMVSLREAFALFGSDGGPNVDVGDLLVKLTVSLLIILLATAVYILARRTLRWTLTRSHFPKDAQGPIFLALRGFVLALAVLAILGQFGVSRAVLGDAALAVIFAFLFYLGWWVTNRLLLAAVDRMGIERSLRQLLRNVIAVAVSAIGFVTVMDQFGVNVLAAITALGVVGIAVGLGAQDTIGNFISGITLLLERPFRIGDWIDVGGKVGRVESIRLRTTLIIDRDNIQTVIPNAQVAAGQIVNLSGGGPLRLRIPVGIAYKESAAEAREVLLPVLTSYPDVLKGTQFTPSVLVTGLGASSVDLWMIVWIGADRIPIEPRIRSDLIEQGKAALDQAGIEIPFPHLQLFVDDAKGFEPVLAPFLRGRDG